MLAIRDIVRNPEELKAVCQARGSTVDVGRILELEAARRKAVAAMDTVRKEMNALAKDWRGAEPEERRRRVEALKHQERERKAALEAVTTELNELLSWLPNWLDPRVPIGGEEAFQVVRTVGTPRDLPFEPRSHDEIGVALGLMDIARAVRAATSRFYMLKGKAVLMRSALRQLFLQRVEEQGFELISLPELANRRTFETSGYLPFSGRDNFKVENDDLFLIGTSEQTLLGMHMEETLDRLPLLYLGDSMCFRTEAGAAGKDTAGGFRAHQFYKVEQIVYCLPSESERWLQTCLANEEWLLQQLGIPYRVILLPSGDLGAPALIKYDTEGWFPYQEKYRELTSDSNLGEFQTRRGNIRYKIGNERGFPHTISATGFTDRLIFAILENYQQEDGSALVPEALVPHLGGVRELRPAGRRQSPGDSEARQRGHLVGLSDGKNADTLRRDATTLRVPRP